MKKSVSTKILAFVLGSFLIASAMPTVGGRVKSYNPATGIMTIQMESGTLKKIKFSKGTPVEWKGQSASASAIPVGSKVSIQLAGGLSDSPLIAGKLVEWHDSEKVVAKGPSAPYYTEVSQYATTSGGGGKPDGAPTMDRNFHQTMASVAQGGSQNGLKAPGPNGQSNGINRASSNYRGPNYHHRGQAVYDPGTPQNQATALTSPLELQHIDPYNPGPAPAGLPPMPAMPGMPSGPSSPGTPGMPSAAPGMSPGIPGASAPAAPSAPGMMIPTGPSSAPMPAGPGMMPATQMGAAGDVGTMMGIDGDNGGMMGIGNTTAYGNGVETVSGRVLEAAIEKGYVTIQSFQHPNLIRVWLQQANAPMQLLVPGQMIQVTGRQTSQGLQAVEIKAPGGNL